MSKTIEFNVPRKGADDLQTTETGEVAWFQIAGQRVKFVMQECGLKGIMLVHWASGRIACNTDAVRSVKLRLWKSSPNGCTTNREACRQALEAAERKHGATHMLTVMSSAPIINK